MHILELSNGPTLAFKDMAMQLLGNLFEYALDKQHQELNILGATSGDTGSAAEYAMRGKRGVRVFMLSPNGKMSAFQRAQMYSLQDENIHNIAINGMFDDAQDMVITLTRPPTRLAPSIRSTGGACQRKSCITLRGISQRPNRTMNRLRFPCRRAILAISAQDTSRA